MGRMTNFLDNFKFYTQKPSKEYDFLYMKLLPKTLKKAFVIGFVLFFLNPAFFTIILFGSLIYLELKIRRIYWKASRNYPRNKKI
jgi:hypothetical protein